MNKIFLLEKLKSPFCLCIYLKSHKLTQEESDVLDHLTSRFDVFAIFPKSLTKEIDPGKFCPLYRIVGYMETSQKSMPEISVYILDYLHEFYKKSHVWYAFTDIESLEKLDPDQINNILRSQTEQSVVSRERLDAKELEEIYLDSSWSWNRNDLNMYLTHKSDSEIIFLRQILIKELLDFVSESEGKKYIETFRDTSFKNFLASWIERYNERERKLPTIRF